MKSVIQLAWGILKMQVVLWAHTQTAMQIFVLKKKELLFINSQKRLQRSHYKYLITEYIFYPEKLDYSPTIAVGIAIPDDPNQHGYIYEYQSTEESAEQAGQAAERMAAKLMATVKGVALDHVGSYDVTTKRWNIDGVSFASDHLCQHSVLSQDGNWLCGVAAAVFIF